VTQVERDAEVASPFADWLERTARGLGYESDAKLAAALDLPQSTIGRWRRPATGRKTVSRPSVEHLVRISSLFGVAVEQLLVLAGHVPPEAVRRAEDGSPATPTTATENLIVQAGLPEAVEQVVRAYLRARLKEERVRLAALIRVIGEAQGRDKAPAALAGGVAELLATDLPAHVAELLADARDAYASSSKKKPPKSRR
jgi:transcriptional regulator with XRE-family HTH domain